MRDSGRGIIEVTWVWEDILLQEEYVLQIPAPTPLEKEQALMHVFHHQHDREVLLYLTQELIHLEQHPGITVVEVMPSFRLTYRDQT